MEPERGPALLDGRLHPATIVLHGARYARSLALFAVIMVVRIVRGDPIDRWIFGPMLGLLLLTLLMLPVVHWLRYRYRLTADTLEITSGLLSRTVRRIPVSRIQDLAMKASLVQRALGVVVVQVQTSSTAKAEAELDVVATRDADALVRALADLRGAPAQAAPERAAPPALAVSTGALVLRGLTDNRAGLLIVAALGGLERMLDADEALGRRFWDASLHAFHDWFGGGLWSTIVVVLAGLGAVWLLGYMASVVFNVLTFGGFELSVENGVVIRRHGLLTRIRKATPSSRIQALRVHQSPFRRLAGIASLEAHDMGSSTDPEARRVGQDTFVPAASPAALRSLFTAIFPAFDEGALIHRRVSPRMIRRGATLGAIVGLAAATALLASELAAHWEGVGWPALVLGPLLGSVALGTHARLAHARLTIGHGGGFVVVRRGVLFREETLVPITRLQAVELSRGPLDRFHGVATVRLVVGGGTSVSVANVPSDEAQTLCAELLGRTAGLPSAAPVEEALPG